MVPSSRAPVKPAATLRLKFRDEGKGARDDEPVATDLSAATFSNGHLWVANDELSHVERLTHLPEGDFGKHKPFSLAQFLKLPAGDDGEMDIEGLDVDGGYLWIVGSHSATRRKPKPNEHDAETVLDRLNDIKNSPNRYFLGRVPLVRKKDGTEALCKTDKKRGFRACALPMKKKQGNVLLKLLRKDEHIGPFAGLPAKENGFDVEGLAVRGHRAFLGLRGPVLRGWAIILELHIVEGKKANLELAQVDDSGDLYRKHFVNLDGLGIRELCFQGDDLLVLAGPTMDLDGPVVLWRWKKALESTHSDVVLQEDIERVCNLPYGQGVDHAEGLAWVPHAKGDMLLVLYDSPHPSRLEDDARSLTADLFAI